MTKPWWTKDGPTFRQIFNAIEEAGLADEHFEYNGYYGTSDNIDVIHGCLSVITKISEDRKFAIEFRLHLDTLAWETIELECEEDE